LEGKLNQLDTAKKHTRALTHNHTQVICCASAVHQNQINTIQKLTEEYNALKKTVDGGDFKTEESRKRKEMDSTASLEPPGVWEQLESMCRNPY
jgi:hypothetical protein